MRKGTESTQAALDPGATWYLISALSKDVLCELKCLHLFSMQTRIRAGGCSHLIEPCSRMCSLGDLIRLVTASSTLKKNDPESASDYDNKNTENI